jgi:uncharacterized membrane protein YidH (DUF202 family)
MAEPIKENRVQNRRVHMANERTFLAWIRTSIGIMAFGFVVEKFALFVRQMDRFLYQTTTVKALVPSTKNSEIGYSSIVGIILIGLGAVMGLLAFIRYKKVEKQIDENAFYPSVILDTLLTLAVVVVGLFFIVYLTHIF